MTILPEVDCFSILYALATEMSPHTGCPKWPNSTEHLDFYGNCSTSDEEGIFLSNGELSIAGPLNRTNYPSESLGKTTQPMWLPILDTRTQKPVTDLSGPLLAARLTSSEPTSVASLANSSGLRLETRNSPYKEGDVSLLDPTIGESSSRHTWLAASSVQEHSPPLPPANAMVLYERRAPFEDVWRVNSSECRPARVTGRIENIVEASDISPLKDFQRIGKSSLPDQNSWNKHCACRADCVIRYRHYRVLLETAGEALFAFHSSRELISVTWDAMGGHWIAYQAGIRYTDISAANILIQSNRKGVLIDWDIAKDVDSADNQSGWHNRRIGSWQFLSAAIISDPYNHRHVLADDLEAFIHVLTWVALRFCPNSLSTGALDSLLHKYFDSGIHSSQGPLKILVVACGSFRPRVRYTLSPILSDFLMKVTLALSARYKEVSRSTIMWDHMSIAEQEEEDHAVSLNEQRLQALESSEWMLCFGWDAISTKYEWPASDEAQARVYDGQDGGGGYLGRPSVVL
ncbi:hypothetical protein BV25DRAFT_1991412, partial [Artomyces pyxidatus]